MRNREEHKRDNKWPLVDRALLGRQRVSKFKAGAECERPVRIRSDANGRARHLPHSIDGTASLPLRQPASIACVAQACRGSIHAAVHPGSANHKRHSWNFRDIAARTIGRKTLALNKTIAKAEKLSPEQNFARSRYTSGTRGVCVRTRSAFHLATYGAEATE